MIALIASYIGTLALGIAVGVAICTGGRDEHR
jgi:hypothetical protein